MTAPVPTLGSPVSQGWAPLGALLHSVSITPGFADFPRLDQDQYLPGPV